MNHLIQAIIKWLVIATLVLAVIVVLLLGLGYLLIENERETKALKASLDVQQTDNNAQLRTISIDEYKQQLAQKEQQKAIEQQLIANVEQLKNIKQAEQIIVEHLTCQNVTQCRFFDTQSTDMGCIIAVNVIGYSKLNKLNLNVSSLLTSNSQCEEQEDQLALTCHHNICSIK